MRWFIAGILGFSMVVLGSGCRQQVAVTGSGNAQANAADDPVKQDPKNIQGTWVVTSCVAAGKQGDQFIGNKMIFGADKFIGEDRDGKKGEGNAYRLDPAKKPKTIDISDPDLGSTPGIYELNGDTLTICLAIGKERPTEFKSDTNSLATLMVLKRQRP
jgi:uncharacterized protein (TIGR03067 family)